MDGDNVVKVSICLITSGPAIRHNIPRRGMSLKYGGKDYDY